MKKSNKQTKKNKTKTIYGVKFAQHPSGLWVSKNGLVFVPATNRRKEHFTYGSNLIGYKSVTYKGNVYYVHRLVAETYIPNPHHLPMINHRNEERSENTIYNLEWCDKWTNNTANGVSVRRAQNRNKHIYQYTTSGELVKEWDSIASIEKELGIHNTSIGANVNGYTRTCRGFVWKRMS